MTHIELEAARRLLFLSQTEAAALVGVADRTWRRWESGKVRVPEDVAALMSELLTWRSLAIEATLDAIEKAEVERGQAPESAALVWYVRAEDFASLPGRDARFFRPHQSVMAEVAAVTGARLIPFDRAAYEAWRAEHGRADSESLRAEWAARTYSRGNRGQ